MMLPFISYVNMRLDMFLLLYCLKVIQFLCRSLSVRKVFSFSVSLFSFFISSQLTATRSRGISLVKDSSISCCVVFRKAFSGPLEVKLQIITF